MAEAAMPINPEFQVICLCAEWCGTCREYRPAFVAVAADFPDMNFRWLDIEDDAEAVGDLDIENFPTLLIGRPGAVLYFGTILPHPGHLRRLLDNFADRSGQAGPTYDASRPEQLAWQNDADLQRLCRNDK